MATEHELLARLHEIFDVCILDIKTLGEKSSDCGTNNLFSKTTRAKPFCIVRPSSNYNEQLKKLMELACTYKRKVIVRGGGSGVCGAFKVRGGEIIVDITDLNKIEIIKKPTAIEDGLVIAEAGVFGNKLDDFLKQQGLTHGHYPASLAISTVGGWSNTRASGHFSLYFGNIENLVVAVEGVNGKGEFIKLGGYDLKKVFRMEGTTMIVTRVWLKVFTIPANDYFCSFRFNSIDDTVCFFKKMPDLKKRLDRLGVRLYTARAYDFIDYQFMSKPRVGDSHKPVWLKKLAYFIEKQLCRAGTRIENLVDVLERQNKTPWTVIIYMASNSTDALMQAAGIIKSKVQIHSGEDLGPTIAHSWYTHRFKLGYDKVIERFNAGITVDTFDCTMAWEKVIEAYEVIRAIIFKFGLVGAHIGIDWDRPYLYFIFGLASKNPENYRTAKDEILHTCIKNGIATTHHHGIGEWKAGPAKTLVPYAYSWDWYLNTAIPAKLEMDPWNILSDHLFSKLG